MNTLGNSCVECGNCGKKLFIGYNAFLLVTEEFVCSKCFKEDLSYEEKLGAQKVQISEEDIK